MIYSDPHTTYPFFVEPVTKRLDDNVQIITWKYDDDQNYYNFEIHFDLESVKDDFHWESHSFFKGDFRDQIEMIRTVMIKDGLLIIAGWKEKGNEED